jgi:hypothetical protein
MDEPRTVYPVDVVLVEGILAFYNKDIVDMFNMKLFVDTDPDTRLSRRGLYLCIRSVDMVCFAWPDLGSIASDGFWHVSPKPPTRMSQNH